MSPAGLPPSIVSRLNAEVAAVLEDTGLLQTLESWGIQASAGTPEAFGSHVRSEALRWKERVSRFGVELE